MLKEEFESTLDQIEPSVNAIIYAGRDLITNSKLSELLYMVLMAGNFLNNVRINFLEFHKFGYHDFK